MRKLIFLVLTLVVLSSFSTSTTWLSTNLKITVMDDLGNFIEGADVTLYGNEEDYRAEKNPVSETLKTNEKGQVTFKKLKPKAYFVYVEKGDMNNDGGAAQTNPLEEGKLNKVNIIIE